MSSKTDEQAEEFDRIADECRQIIEADSARVTKPMNTMFLVIGTYRRTENDPDQWYWNNEPCDFEYLDEKVVANAQ